MYGILLVKYFFPFVCSSFYSEDICALGKVSQILDNYFQIWQSLVEFRIVTSEGGVLKQRKITWTALKVSCFCSDRVYQSVSQLIQQQRTNRHLTSGDKDNIALA